MSPTTVKQWVKSIWDNSPPTAGFNSTRRDPWKQLSIQLVVIDTPGNQSVVNQLLRRPRLAEADTNRLAAAPSRSSTEAMALPYRIGPDDAITGPSCFQSRDQAGSSPAPSRLQRDHRAGLRTPGAITGE